MNLSLAVIRELAAHLESAELKARDVVKITDAHPNMDWEDAYAIQDTIRRRKEARGIKTVGFKAGLTSHAKMKQMGVDTPVFGFLSESFAVADSGRAKMVELIHPKVEPEIAFVLKRSLKGPDCDIAAVLAATDYVAPALEVIDSRYRDFKFDLKSVLADNCSSSRFVVASRGTPVGNVNLPCARRGHGKERRGRHLRSGRRRSREPGDGGCHAGEARRQARLRTLRRTRDPFRCRDRGVPVKAGDPHGSPGQGMGSTSIGELA